MDDYSRMTWLFLMKHRSDLPSIISKFYNEIFTQFGKRIRIFRADNALEYVQSIVTTFCDAHGIIHQNGVAERKHRHLLDVARTLMFNMHVPKQF